MYVKLWLGLRLFLFHILINMTSTNIPSVLNIFMSAMPVHNLMIMVTINNSDNAGYSVDLYY